MAVTIASGGTKTSGCRTVRPSAMRTVTTADQSQAIDSKEASVLGEIGFIGLGHMGTAMAANLTAGGRRVIAYVRRPDRIGKLEALGLRATTDIADLLDCKVVISMLPDDDAVREVVFGRKDIGLKGLAAGMMG